MKALCCRRKLSSILNIAINKYNIGNIGIESTKMVLLNFYQTSYTSEYRAVMFLRPSRFRSNSARRDRGAE